MKYEWKNNDIVFMNHEKKPMILLMKHDGNTDDVVLMNYEWNINYNMLVEHEWIVFVKYELCLWNTNEI